MRRFLVSFSHQRDDHTVPAFGEMVVFGHRKTPGQIRAWRMQAAKLSNTPDSRIAILAITELEDDE